jgi:ABC-type transport system involved in multi-copper enzyme maturation permease subunit
LNNLWIKQTAAIARFELKRFILARRWIGIYVLALAPVILMYARSRLRIPGGNGSAAASQEFAIIFQFLVEFGIFISCAVVFSQLFRGDILEKTLHFPLLAPVRREIIAAGKYLAGAILVATLFSISTTGALLLRYSGTADFTAFFFDGPGWTHLVRYVAVATLAAIGYGAVFLLVGLLFKNPGVPTLFLLGWESFNFALPSILQRFSVIHYLTPILPVQLDRGPFAIVMDQTSPIVGIPILLVFTAVLVAISGLFLRTVEITYSAE